MWPLWLQVVLAMLNGALAFLVGVRWGRAAERIDQRKGKRK